MGGGGHGGNHSLGLFHRSFLGFWRLTVDLADRWQGDFKHELAFAGLVELNRDVLFGTKQHGAGTELGVFHLSPGDERRFTGHREM